MAMLGSSFGSIGCVVTAWPAVLRCDFLSTHLALPRAAGLHSCRTDCGDGTAGTFASSAISRAQQHRSGSPRYRPTLTARGHAASCAAVEHVEHEHYGDVCRRWCGASSAFVGHLGRGWRGARHRPELQVVLRFRLTRLTTQVSWFSMVLRANALEVRVGSVLKGKPGCFWSRLTATMSN